jgi:hypothetical protein
LANFLNPKGAFENMRNRIFLGTILAGAIALVYAFTLAPPTAEAGGAKNLKVYPKDTDKKQIKKDMKVMAKALGVQCDHCHNMSGMDKDTPMKEKARKMMKMTISINKDMKKDGFKAEVTCKTCHNGKKEP